MEALALGRKIEVHSKAEQRQNLSLLTQIYALNNNQWCSFLYPTFLHPISSNVAWDLLRPFFLMDQWTPWEHSLHSLNAAGCLRHLSQENLLLSLTWAPNTFSDFSQMLVFSELFSLHHSWALLLIQYFQNTCFCHSWYWQSLSSNFYSWSTGSFCWWSKQTDWHKRCLSQWCVEILTDSYLICNTDYIRSNVLEI